MSARWTAGEYPVLLATLPPSGGQHRFASTIIAVFLVAFAVTVPFAHTRLPRLDAWIPGFTATLVVTDLVTSVLLFSQFSISRQRALLVLAVGYLFSALIVVPYALTFPGVFAPTGLLGAGLQSAVWLYIVWHVAWPLSVIGYVLLKNRSGTTSAPQTPVRFDIAVSVALVFGVVCVLTWFVTAQHDLLPRLYLDGISLSPLVKAAAGLVFLSCAAALALLWSRGSSVLDLWLMVTVSAWLLEITLQGLFLTDRFSLAWYVGRTYSLIAGSVVLIVLLWEAAALYAQLVRSVMRLRAASREREISMDTMVASIAHEVNQPLGSITLNAETALLLLAQTPPDNDEVRAALTDIAASAARGTQVIASLRAMFRDSAHARTLVDANDLVREALAILDIELQAQRVSVSTELSPALPPVLADRGLLQQVFINLIMNAIEAMRPVADHARRLRMTSEFVQGTSDIRMTVEDSGTGIGTPDKERIFEPFFTTKPTGTGIGLTICRSIIDAHGGNLRASANKPQGTIFEVLVPVSV